MQEQNLDTKIEKISVGVDVTVAGNGFRFFVSHESKETVRQPSPQTKKIEEKPEKENGNERQP
jgi:hypothetical protein